MKTHILKIRRDFLSPVEQNDKTFEIRKNDRNFQAGDRVLFQPVSDKGHIGEAKKVFNDCYVITYVLNHLDFPEGIPEGYCVFAIANEGDHGSE